MSLIKKIMSCVIIVLLVCFLQFPLVSAADLSSAVNVDANVSKLGDNGSSLSGSSVDDLLIAWATIKNTWKADEILVNASARINSLKDLLRLAETVHQKNSADAIINNMGRSGVIADVTIRDIFKCSDKQTSLVNADKILLVGAKHLRSVKELAEFRKKAHYESTKIAIDRIITEGFNNNQGSVDDLLIAWAAIKDNERKADEILINASARINSLKDLFRLAVTVHQKTSIDSIIRNMERPGVIIDVTVSDVCNFCDKLPSFSNTDKVLLVCVRYFRNEKDLAKFRKKAHYNDTKATIDKIIEVLTTSSQRSDVKSKTNENLIVDETEVTAAKGAVSKIEIEIIEATKVKLSSCEEVNVNLTDKDIQELNYPKISEFALNFKNGVYKKTEKLYTMKKGLIEKLKPAAMNEPKVREILEALK